MAYEMTIEIFDGETPASRWLDAHFDRLIEIAHSYGVRDWRAIKRNWGVILEVSFKDENHWEAFRLDPSVVAAFDAAPRILTRRGWGGSAGVRWPRRPKPFAGAGAAELPTPEEPTITDAVSRWRDRVGSYPNGTLQPIPL